VYRAAVQALYDGSSNNQKMQERPDGWSATISHKVVGFFLLDKYL
jgi:hypothetical protein